jgi:hypothetical protein
VGVKNGGSNRISVVGVGLPGLALRVVLDAAVRLGGSVCRVVSSVGCDGMQLDFMGHDP